jgi:hypothetical protein
MKLKCLFAFLFVVCSATLPAQMPDEHESYGYLFAGVTNPHKSAFTLFENNFAHLGGGGEAMFNRWFGFGGEVGVLLPSSDRSRAVGLGSVGPQLHFLPSTSRFDPFVAGGYTVLVRGGVGHLWYSGAGLNYWTSRRFGVRAEFRNHVWPTQDSLQLIDFRFGIVIR